MPNCPLTLRTVKGSKLTFNELDGNFISLNNCISNLQSQIDALDDNSLNNRWHVPVGTTVVINDGYQGFIYGDLYVEGLIELNGDSQLVILNGDVIMSGGTISGTGVTYLIDLPEYNTFLTGGTYNTSTQALDLSGNYGFNAFSIDLSYLSNDITVTGGTYNSSTGTVTFYNNSGGTFDVSGFLTGYTNYYTTDATLNGTNLEFDRTDLSNAYSVDLTPLKFTGNTISECIPELYVSNIYSCSPLYINPNDEGDVWIGSVSLFIDSSTYHVGVGISPPQARLHVNNTSSSNSLLVEDSTNPDATPFVVNNIGSVGVGTPNPSEKLEVSGKTKTISLQITSGATDGYILKSDTNGNASWVDPNTTLPPSLNYGLFAQTGNSTPITNTVVETTLLDGGVGTLTVPANGFKVGDSFKIELAGHISCNSAATLRIRIKSGAVILGDTGVVAMDTATNKHWNVKALFTIRALGAAGAASIATGGVFSYSKTSGNNFEGFDFSTVNNTTFDTTTSNALDVTAEWGAANVVDTIYSEVFVLNKVY